MPSDNVQEGGRILQWLRSLGFELDLKKWEPDKWVHISLFLIMVLSWCWGWAELKIHTISKIILFVITALLWFLYGVAMEFVQEALRNGRSYDVKDMIADGIGCGLGFLLSLLLFRKKLLIKQG